MTRREISIGCTCLAIGLSSALAWVSNHHPVQAQAAHAAGTDYQISAWSNPGLSSTNGLMLREPSYGAYLVDTKRGSVYLIEKDKKPVFIGDTTQH